jgi:hypothetical protein
MKLILKKTLLEKLHDLINEYPSEKIDYIELTKTEHRDLTNYIDSHFRTFSSYLPTGGTVQVQEDYFCGIKIKVIDETT